jgi:hypothetical protein
MSVTPTAEILHAIASTSSGQQHTYCIIPWPHIQASWCIYPMAINEFRIILLTIPQCGFRWLCLLWLTSSLNK